MTLLRDMAAAFMLLTRFPVPVAASDDRRGFGDIVWAFPIVGASIGWAATCGYYFAIVFGGNSLIGSVVALATAVVCSGAMHEDGLADFFDGMGGQDTERRLAIMRDSRIGTFGVLSLFFVLLLQVLFLNGNLAGRGLDLPNWSVIIAAFVLSRGAMVLPMYFLRPARGDGLGESVSQVSFVSAGLSVLLCVVIAVWLLGAAAGVGALLGAAVGSGLTAWIAWRMLGGQTGDVLGASCCFGFLGALVGLSIVHRYSVLLGA